MIYADGARRRPGAARYRHRVEPLGAEPNCGRVQSRLVHRDLPALRRRARRDAMLDLVVNDHADVDGFLALYAPARERHRAPALRHARGRRRDGRLPRVGRTSRRFGSRRSCRCCCSARTRPADVGDCYAEAMKIVTGVLDGSRPEAPAVTAGWERHRARSRTDRSRRGTGRVDHRPPGLVRVSRRPGARRGVEDPDPERDRRRLGLVVAAGAQPRARATRPDRLGTGG